MAKRICITEEQYNMALKEGVELKADVAGANGDVKKAVDTTKRNARESGVDLNKATISLNANETNESTVFVTKKQLKEARLKALKENSKTYTVKDFMKKLNID